MPLNHASEARKAQTGLCFHPVPRSPAQLSTGAHLRAAFVCSGMLQVLRDKDRRAQQRLDRCAEERGRKMEEQRRKEQKRRAAAEERRRQQQGAEKVRGRRPDDALAADVSDLKTDSVQPETNRRVTTSRVSPAVYCRGQVLSADQLSAFSRP